MVVAFKDQIVDVTNGTIRKGEGNISINVPSQLSRDVQVEDVDAAWETLVKAVVAGKGADLTKFAPKPVVEETDEPEAEEEVDDNEEEDEEA